MDINTMLDFIVNNGFAIGVACFCLYKMDQSIKDMNDTLTELKTLIKYIVEEKEREVIE